MLTWRRADGTAAVVFSLSSGQLLCAFLSSCHSSSICPASSAYYLLCCLHPPLHHEAAVTARKGAWWVLAWAFHLHLRSQAPGDNFEGAAAGTPARLFPKGSSGCQGCSAPLPSAGL